MSGGVDSSVAAFLLAQDGYAVTGATMNIGITANDQRRHCGSSDAMAEARAVCERLGIEHRVFDFSRPMAELVIGKFVREYLRGRTPNPCIDCNRYLKFGILLAKARAIDCEFLATGHYARIVQQEGQARLCRPRDRRKDQTYFLYRIAAADLGALLFPLSELCKAEVRDIARKAHLPVAEKTESQDICFAPRTNCGEFFPAAGGGEQGEIVDSQGRVLGRHKGIARYTIGQRSGLGISAPAPLYVVRIEPEANRIVVGSRNELRAHGLIAADLNLFCAELPRQGEAKIRYRKEAIPCSMSREGDRLHVMFHEAQEAVTPGQAVVLYAGEEVLGGAVIEEAIA